MNQVQNLQREYYERERRNFLIAVAVLYALVLVVIVAVGLNHYIEAFDVRNVAVLIISYVALVWWHKRRISLQSKQSDLANYFMVFIFCIIIFLLPVSLIVYIATQLIYGISNGLDISIDNIVGYGSGAFVGLMGARYAGEAVISCAKKIISKICTSADETSLTVRRS